MPKPTLGHLPGGVLALSAPDMETLLRAVLARNAAFRFRARGDSMHPFIRDGDHVIVSPALYAGLRPGDVVAFVGNGGRLIVHRIIVVSSGFFLLQGDNNPGRDGWIPAQNILGRVTRVERDGRRIQIGLGPERAVVAWLARKNLLRVMVNHGRRVLRPLLKGLT